MSSQLYIDPFHADSPAVEEGSNLSIYFDGEIGEELVNWAWLSGDDPFKQGGAHAACVASAAFDDIYHPAKGHKGRNARRLVSALREGPEAVLNFVRHKRNLRGLWAVDAKCKKEVKGVRGRAVLALAMAEVRARGIPCPNEI